MNPALRNLYQGMILDHHARPHHHGPLPSRTHEARAHNPLCGDHVTVRLRIEGATIAEAWFEGEGCALSRASASLLTLAVAGKTAGEALAVAGEMDRLVAPGGEQSANRAMLGDLVALEGVRDVPARRRCVTLPWEALRKAISEVRA